MDSVLIRRLLPRRLAEWITLSARNQSRSYYMADRPNTMDIMTDRRVNGRFDRGITATNPRLYGIPVGRTDNSYNGHVVFGLWRCPDTQHDY